MQYKTHLCGFSEYQNGTIFHAAPTVLHKLDRMQTSYVHELHITEESAFLDFNFAPSCLRRDISILGFLHKRVLGESHVAIQELFPFLPHYPPWHNKQLESHIYDCTARPELFNRSIFGMVHVYNRLPQDIVDLSTVCKFQNALTNIIRYWCNRGHVPWKSCLHNCANVLRACQDWAAFRRLGLRCLPFN